MIGSKDIHVGNDWCLELQVVLMLWNRESGAYIDFDQCSTKVRVW